MNLMHCLLNDADNIAIIEKSTIVYIIHETMHGDKIMTKSNVCDNIYSVYNLYEQMGKLCMLRRNDGTPT